MEIGYEVIEKIYSQWFFQFVSCHESRDRKFGRKSLVQIYTDKETQEIYKSWAHEALVNAEVLARISTQDRLGIRFQDRMVMTELLNDGVKTTIKGVLKFGICHVDWYY